MNIKARSILIPATILCASLTQCTDKPDGPGNTPNLAADLAESPPDMAMEPPDLAMVKVEEPTLDSVSPATSSTAGGVTVTLKGKNFTTGAVVTFGGTQAAQVKVVSPTEISVVKIGRASCRERV